MVKRSELCDEHDISRLVHEFYARVRSDEFLGPIFNEHVSDWDLHLGKMVDFWSSALRGTATYRGTPMPKHVALPGLNDDMFRRWLALFRETTATIGDAAFGERANDLALRVAQSLWYGYQIHRTPDRLPAELTPG